MENEMAHLKHSGKVRQAAHAKRTALVEILSETVAANDADTFAPEFDVEGTRYSLAQMLADNADDPDFCEWAREAEPGEFFPGIASCQCIAAGDLSESDLIAIDRAYEQCKSADCASFGRLSADASQAVELARDPRSGYVNG